MHPGEYEIFFAKFFKNEMTMRYGYSVHLLTKCIRTHKTLHAQGVPIMYRLSFASDGQRLRQTSKLRCRRSYRTSAGVRPPAGAGPREGAGSLFVRGSAASFVHHVKAGGIADFTEVYRSTQDIDIAVDGYPQAARELEARAAEEFPHFLGDKAKWEMRSLRQAKGVPGEFGYKEALLNDPDFSLQNSDSHSLGLVSLVDGKISDLRSGDLFLKDVREGAITFLRSSRHFESARASRGENPEILSAIRLLVKAFQHGLRVRNWREVEEVVREFEPSSITSSVALHKIAATARKLILHAADLEYAIATLERLGLRDKLIFMGKKNERGNFAWWLNKKPLPSFELGQGTGKTAKELKIDLVTHDTSDFLAFESLTRTNKINAFVSRENTPGEAAAHGEGLYAMRGKKGARGGAFPVTLKIDPNARERSDFVVNEEMVILKNKRAGKIVGSSLDWGLEELLMIARGKMMVEFDESNKAVLVKIRRKLGTFELRTQVEELGLAALEIAEIALNETAASILGDPRVRTLLDFFREKADGVEIHKMNELVIQKKEHPLIWAARYGDVDMIEALLTTGAKVNEKNAGGGSALIWAAARGHSDIVEKLLMAGADVNTRNDWGDTALILAAGFGHLDVVAKLFANWADMSAKNNRGDTALIWRRQTDTWM